MGRQQPRIGGYNGTGSQSDDEDRSRTEGRWGPMRVRLAKDATFTLLIQSPTRVFAVYWAF
jgi:hypothetical protein